MKVRAPGKSPDPGEIYAMYEERDAGLSSSQIRARHDLSGVAVSQLLRPRTNTKLPTPFELAKDAANPVMAVPMYWLGFITASGRVFYRNDQRTLVLSLDQADVEFAQLMVRDLMRTHIGYETCSSSLNGHQAYVRDRDLAEALLHWGVTTDPKEASVPVAYIPADLLSHFVRGLIEGQLQSPLLEREGRKAKNSVHGQRITIAGSRDFVENLRNHLAAASPAMGGSVEASDAPEALATPDAAETPEPSDRPETALLVYEGDAARAILRYAYQDPVRSSPRARNLVKAFG